MSSFEVKTPLLPREDVVAVVLCGGNSRRMGKDKASLSFLDKPLIEYAVNRLEPDCGRVAVSVAHEVAPEVASDNAFAAAGEIIVDVDTEQSGPLVGVATALRWAAHYTDTKYLLTAPVDTPFLPPDLLTRLHAALLRYDRRSAVATSGNRMHGLHAFYHVDLAATAEDTVLDGGERMLQAFHLSLGSAPARFEAQPFDPFFNINTPDDITMATAIARQWQITPYQDGK